MSLPPPTPQQTLLEHIWQSALNQCASGSGDIVLPITIQGSIGHDGVLIIMQRFSAFTGQPAHLSLDDALGTIRITRGPTAVPTDVQNPAQNSHALDVPQNALAVSQQISAAPLPPTPTAVEGRSAPRKPSARRRPKDRVPRPPNAFILYRQHHHPIVKAANPGMHNNNISIILGKQWKDEPAGVRSHFKSLSEEIKRKHYLDHPEYQYQPRKSSEKKRRASHRKAGGFTSINAVPASQPVTSEALAGGITQPETTVMPQAFATSGSQASEILIDAHVKSPIKFSATAESPSLTAALLESFNLTVAKPPSDAQESVAASVPATAEITDRSPGHQVAITPDDTSGTKQEAGDCTTSEVKGHSPVGQNASITNNNTDASNPPQQQPAAPTASEPVGHPMGDNHNASDASSITRQQTEIDSDGTLTEDEFGGAQLNFPFTGQESFLDSVLEDWNEQQPFDARFPSGSLPLTIDAQTAAQDRDYYLDNWAEIDLRARLELLDEEHEFLRMFPSQQ